MVVAADPSDGQFRVLSEGIEITVREEQAFKGQGFQLGFEVDEGDLLVHEEEDLVSSNRIIE